MNRFEIGADDVRRPVAEASRADEQPASEPAESPAATEPPAAQVADAAPVKPRKTNERKAK